MRPRGSKEACMPVHALHFKQVHPEQVNLEGLWELLAPVDGVTHKPSLGASDPCAGRSCRCPRRILGTDLEDTGNSAARPAGLLATRQALRRAALAHLEGLWALLAPVGWLASSLLLRALSSCAGLGRRLGHRLGRR